MLKILQNLQQDLAFRPLYLENREGDGEFTVGSTGFLVKSVYFSRFDVGNAGSYCELR